MSTGTKLDWVLLAILLVSLLLSLWKGFTRELVSLAALVWGLVLACQFYTVPARWLAPHVRAPEIAALAGFLGIVLAAMIAGGVLSWLAGKLVHKAGLRWFDRLLGASFGLVRGLLICLIIILVMAAFPMGAQPLAESHLAPYLVHGARVIVLAAPQEMRARFRSGFEKAQKIWDGRLNQ